MLNIRVLNKYQYLDKFNNFVKELVKEPNIFLSNEQYFNQYKDFQKKTIKELVSEIYNIIIKLQQLNIIKFYFNPLEWNKNHIYTIEIDKNLTLKKKC